MLSYGGLLKQKHKILNLDNGEEEKAHSIIAMWNWERKNYFIKE